MALARAITSKLNENSSIEGKLTLAKRIFTCQKINLINKKEIILNWLFDNIGHCLNNDSPSDSNILWQTLHELLVLELESTNTQVILLKSNCIKIILEALKKCSPKDDVLVMLHCIRTCLKSPSLYGLLIADGAVLIAYLFASLELLTKIHQFEPVNVLALNIAKSLASTVMELSNSVSLSSDISKLSIFNNNLREIATFMHIATGDKDMELLSEKISSNIFNSIETKDFESLLTVTEHTHNKPKRNASVLKFFRILQRLLSEKANTNFAPEVVGATLMKNLMMTCLSECKSGFYPFKFLSVMCAVSGLDIPLQITANSCCCFLFKNETAEATVNILALSKLLEACASFPQYFSSTFTCMDDYIKPLDWLKGVEAALLDTNSSRCQSEWFKCFQHLLKISPSIVEGNIVSVIKGTLLDIRVQNGKAKKEYCNFFILLLHVHSQLRQLPKLFVKILLALTECVQENCAEVYLSEGLIYPSILKSVAKFVQEMPFGQSAELWKIFIETYTTFGDMSQMFKQSKGALFFTVQLFSTFLMHSKFFDDSVPANIYNRFGQLIDLTYLELQKNIAILLETKKEVQPIQNSFLALTYAIGEVKIAYEAYEEKLQDSSTLKFPDHALDLSVSLPFFERKHSVILLLLLEGGNKLQSFLVFRLLLQKIKILVYKNSLFQNESSHLQLTISVILKHLEENNSSVLSWDLDMCSLNEQNYTTCLWRELMKTLPVFLEFLSFKDLFLLCGLMQDVLHASSDSLHNEIDARCVILSLLKNEFIHESKQFQTVFIASLWKPEYILSKKRTLETENECQRVPQELFSKLYTMRKKWTKFSDSTPKDHEDMNDLWLNLKEISVVLNEILVSNIIMEQKLQISKIQNVLELLNCLPLEYLLPSNQLRCIIGLSVLLILIPSNLERIEALFLVKKISFLLVTIISGVRSVWLFDFVKSGPFLKVITNSLEKVINQEDDDSYEIIKIFIDKLIGLSLSNGENISEMETFVNELATEMKVKKFSALIMCAIVQKISQKVRRSYLHESYRAACSRLISIACSSIIKCTKKSVDKEDKDFSFLFIRCYSEILDIIMSASCDIDEDKQNKCLDLLPKLLDTSFQKIHFSEDESIIETSLQFVSKVCLHMKELTKFIQKDFVELSWTATIFHLEKKSQNIKKRFMTSNILPNREHFPVTDFNCKKFNHMCPVLLTNSENIDGDCNLNVTKSNKNMVFDLSSEIYLSETEIATLKSLLASSSEKEISLLFQKINNEKEYSDIATMDIFSFQMKLQIMKHIMKCAQEKSMLVALSESIQNCLSNLQVLVSQTCDSFICKYMIAIPTLNFVSFALQMGKVLDSHTVMQTLHFCASLKIEIQFNNYLTFIKTFNAIWDIVYGLLTQHTSHVLSSRPAFMFFVSLLLKALVSFGSQDALSLCVKSIHQQMQLCAQNIERLFTMISRNKHEFEKLVPYLIADYVDAVQHVTLEPSIKEHIILGINRLLNICSEDALKMLAVNVNFSCREVYTNLVKNFKQYRNYGTN
ncbi:uncharacterized protein LOC129229798 [Uloborus diversus]|uniref:uncharacterized protein LOC129229798 n=1 Tax=Uloborus diversus TaxID=327109 RepID=UPI00240A5C1A|nr:uncharacterized protein LOC129229798 [Uloborus diversus]